MLNVIEKETFYSPESLAERLQVSLSSIYKLIRGGELPHIRLGKVYRIPATDLQTYLLSKSKKVALAAMPQTGTPLPNVVERFIQLLQLAPLSRDLSAIWLFGSYARGDYGANSDIDLFLILKGGLPNKKAFERSRKISELSEKAMEESGYQDLLSLHEVSENEWSAMKKDRYLLAQSVEKEGVLLWSRH